MGIKFNGGKQPSTKINIFKEKERSISEIKQFLDRKDLTTEERERATDWLKGQGHWLLGNESFFFRDELTEEEIAQEAEQIYKNKKVIQVSTPLVDYYEYLIVDKDFELTYQHASQIVKGIIEELKEWLDVRYEDLQALDSWKNPFEDGWTTCEQNFKGGITSARYIGDNFSLMKTNKEKLGWECLVANHFPESINETIEVNSHGT